MILEWLNAQLHITSLLWLFPIVFMFHDFEEILTVERWVQLNKEKVLTLLPESARKYFYSSFQMTTVQFAKDVFWIFLTITIATILAVVFSFYYVFLMILTIFFVHVFTHLGQALYLKKYTPGVVTSVLLVFPYSAYTFDRLLSEQVVSHGEVLWSGIGAIAILPILFLFLVKERNKAISQESSNL